MACSGTALPFIGNRKSGTEPAHDITFFCENGNADYFLRTVSFAHKKKTSAVKWVEFISDMVSYISLSDHWCDIIVMNVHEITKDKCDDIGKNLKRK
jgi:hypothetical protein